MSLLDLKPIAQWAGIAMPLLYAGITFQYSQTLTLLSTPTTPPTPTSPPKLLATQWLRLYQQGPVWVPPLIHSGVLANLYLAYLSRPSPQPTGTGTPSHHLYLVSALLTLSILPLTFLYFEPGINGACKWKAQALLGNGDDELGRGRDGVGGMLPPPPPPPPPSPEANPGSERGRGEWARKIAAAVPIKASVARHSATEGAKRWAERAEMSELVGAWARRNYGRVAVAVAAAALSGRATLGG